MTITCFINLYLTEETVALNVSTERKLCQRLYMTITYFINLYLTEETVALNVSTERLVTMS
jgi:hypothetical protein